MAKALMLNPISYRNVVKKHGGDMKAAAREWRKLKRSSLANPVKSSKKRTSKRSSGRKGGKAVAKKRKRKTPANGVRSTMVAGKRVTFRTPMPKAWVDKWKAGFEDFLARRPARSVAQPMLMPESWRRAWGAGTLARGPASRLSKIAPRRWRQGVRAYAEQPLDIAATMGELASGETVMNVLAISAGISAPVLGPALVEKVVGRPLGTLGIIGVGAGTGISGYLVANMLGYPDQGRLFFGGAVGGMLANLLLRQLGYGPTPAAGAGIESLLGQATSTDVRTAVEDIVSETLREEGLGQITTEDIEEMGGGVGQMTYDDVESELEGVGGTYGLE